MLKSLRGVRETERCVSPDLNCFNRSDVIGADYYNRENIDTNHMYIAQNERAGFLMFAGVGKKNIASDITVEEFYKLHKNAKAEYLVVIFHAPWCKPCQVIKTQEYQLAIKSLRKKYPNIRLVSMDIGKKEGSLVERFRKSLQVDMLPLVLYVDNKRGTYYLSELGEESRKNPAKILEGIVKEKFASPEALKLPSLREVKAFDTQK